MLFDLLIATLLYSSAYAIWFAVARRGSGPQLPKGWRGTEGDDTFRPLGPGANDDFRPLGDGHGVGRPTCWVCGQPKAWGNHAGCR